MAKLFGAMAAIVLVAFMGCAQPTPTPAPTPMPTATPVPTPTPTFEQQRAMMTTYLRAFNAIDNDFAQVASTVKMPTSQYWSAADLIQANNALGQYVTAAQGALQRLNGLTAPQVGEAPTHLQGAKTLTRDQIAAFQKTRDAINAGNQAALMQAGNELQALGSRASAVNRATESLMLKYNITDVEVNYQFRGK